jgi:hypothetical protein
MSISSRAKMDISESWRMPEDFPCRACLLHFRFLLSCMHGWLGVLTFGGLEQWSFLFLHQWFFISIHVYVTPLYMYIFQSLSRSICLFAILPSPRFLQTQYTLLFLARQVRFTDL